MFEFSLLTVLRICVQQIKWCIKKVFPAAFNLNEIAMKYNPLNELPPLRS